MSTKTSYDDWRGSAKRSQSEEAVVDNMATLTRQMQVLIDNACVVNSPDGSSRCRILSSVRSHWLTFIPDTVGMRPGKSELETLSTRVLVDRGLLVAVRLSATCRGCKRRIGTSANLSPELLAQLSWKSLVPKPDDAISIFWRMEISNSSVSGNTVIR